MDLSPRSPPDGWPLAPVHTDRTVISRRANQRAVGARSLRLLSSPVSSGGSRSTRWPLRRSLVCVLCDLRSLTPKDDFCLLWSFSEARADATALYGVIILATITERFKETITRKHRQSIHHFRHLFIKDKVTKIVGSSLSNVRICCCLTFRDQKVKEQILEEIITQLNGNKYVILPLNVQIIKSPLRDS